MFAYGVMPAALMFSRMSAGHFLQRQRKVTICALVQSASGLNVVLVVPLVMFSLTAHSTASAYHPVDILNNSSFLIYFFAQ